MNLYFAGDGVAPVATGPRGGRRWYGRHQVRVGHRAGGELRVCCGVRLGDRRQRGDFLDVFVGTPAHRVPGNRLHGAGHHHSGDQQLQDEVAAGMGVPQCARKMSIPPVYRSYCCVACCGMVKITQGLHFEARWRVEPGHDPSFLPSKTAVI